MTGSAMTLLPDHLDYDFELFIPML